MIRDYQKSKVQRALRAFAVDHNLGVSTVGFSLARVIADQSWFVRQFGVTSLVGSQFGKSDSGGYRTSTDQWVFSLVFPSYNVTRFDILVELAHALVEEESVEAFHGQEFLRRLLYMVQHEYGVNYRDSLRNRFLKQKVSTEGYDIEWFVANEARKRKARTAVAAG